jgi:predicted dehydrogenase
MRVGIIGSGFMAQVHTAAWRALGVEPVGYSPETPGPYSSYQALLSAVDLVDICTPTWLHHSMAIEAAKAGKHVICEKPLALTLEDAQDMIETCNQAGVRLFVAQVVRFFPQYRLVKQLVEEGRIGQLGVLRLRRVSYPPQKPADHWYFDENRSGGMVVDLMIHDFDYARWLGGDLERVYARANRSTQSAAQYVQVVARFKNDAIALIEGGWANPPGVFRTAVDVAGTVGAIEWDSDQVGPIRAFFPAQADSSSDAAVGLPLAGMSDDPYRAELEHAYQAIQSGTPFAVTAEEALESLRIALAVKESLATGVPVSL